MSKPTKISEVNDLTWNLLDRLEEGTSKETEKETIYLVPKETMEILEAFLTSCEEARKIKNKTNSDEYFDRITEMRMIVDRLNRVHQAVTEGGAPSDYE